VREAAVDGDHVIVADEEVDVAWRDLPARLPEAAVALLLAALQRPSGFEGLWTWERPLAALQTLLEAKP